MGAERDRVSELVDDVSSWRRWGCYVSERAWGTVREDYSPDGAAWDFLSHDQARSKAYRWGDDAIAGLCDRYQILIFAPAFWNHTDPILKERLFGLTNGEGNHGEDVKEYYFHLDNTPTHSYQKYVYKYPQRRFPYEQLVARNQSRSTRDTEYELIDTGILQDERYFELTIEYAKFDPEDIAIRITACNRGPESATLDLLPQLWFRNTWSWGPLEKPRPWIQSLPVDSPFGLQAGGFVSEHEPTIPIAYELGTRRLYVPADGQLLFTGNETNRRRLYGDFAQDRCDTKDAFHHYLIDGRREVLANSSGTKAAVHYRTRLAPGESQTWRLRLTDKELAGNPLEFVDEMVELRRREADEFYDALHPAGATLEERRIQRAAWSGLLWTKQSYLFDVAKWLDGDDPNHPPPAERGKIRNRHWRHLNSLRVLLVPDKWEYPWFAAWDLAFQSVAVASIDPQLAMHQLWVLLFDQFQHPNGQIPAYEWDFSDVNPPVHAWAVWKVYHLARTRWGIRDRSFLEQCFHKLLMNFAWWVNKVDREGNNVFEGGFLGLDNITVIDRSAPGFEGAVLEQSDATGWMGMYCLNLMRIALELARENPAYENLAIKFFQHYVYVAAAMKHMSGGYRLWDDEDGFFYDRLCFSDGSAQRFRVRSLVGLIPLFAVERLDADWLLNFHEFRRNVEWFRKHRPEMAHDVVHVSGRDAESLVLTIVSPDQLRRVLGRVFDPDEFLSPFGLRSLSKSHEHHPFQLGGQEVGYEPAESLGRIKGGNSNWRGPVWFPMGYLLIESLRKLAKAWGDGPRVTTRHGWSATYREAAQLLADRMIGLFCRDADGRIPALGDQPLFQSHPAWRDLPWFHEYFHGDNGAGLGASHQTGWTALVATLIDEYR